jgi:tetratricopeptide (TPR) repeat protein
MRPENNNFSLLSSMENALLHKPILLSPDIESFTMANFLKVVILIASFFCSAAFGNGLQDEEALIPASWTGTKALQAGAYAQAVEELTKRTDDPDTGGRVFKLATVNLLSGDTAKALAYFNAAMKDDALAPLAWTAIGDILQKKHLDSAMKQGSVIACYGRALAVALPKRYRASLFERIKNVVGDDTTAIAGAHFYTEYRQWAGPRPTLQHDSLPDWVAAAVAAGRWRWIDSLVAKHGFDGHGVDAQYAAAAAIDSAGPPDSVLSRTAWFTLAKVAGENRRFVLAGRMVAAARRRAEPGSKISGAALQRFNATLLYDARNYDSAAQDLAAYMKKNGEEPELMLLLASAWRHLDKMDKAAFWYDRFIAASPRYPSLAELLWRRAWMEEARRKTAAAIGFYSRLYSSFPKSSRAEESHVRHGLCLFRLGKLDSADAILAQFEQKNPGSPFFPMVRYWRAKCLCGLKRADSAKALLDSVVKHEPFDFYAHRGRDLMAMLGDTARSRLVIDSVYDLGRALAWLDSVSPSSKKSVSNDDSLNYRRGAVLAAAGTIADAEMFLETLEAGYPGNLSLEFKIGVLYRLARASGPATNAGRRLAWRIPPENRAAIPLAVYTVMYPFYFRDIIKTEAKARKVDPFFVGAVIRQESCFNPGALSPVGAIGLMQIMPATGKTIAQELKEPFSTDSLATPEYNIRYGAYYLHTLLDRFKGSEVLTLASYNGGPQNAEAWASRNKEGDPDLLPEVIDFSETRNYVKRVMANYWMYQKLSRLGTSCIPY